MKFLIYDGTTQRTCLRLMGRKMLVALMMEGKSSQLSEEPNLPYHGGWMHISEDRSSAKPKRERPTDY